MSQLRKGKEIIYDSFLTTTIYYEADHFKIIPWSVSTATMTWWRHQLETFSALLAICAGNSPVPSEFPTQRPVTWSFYVYFDLRLNKRLSKQPWGWWFETPSWSLWRQCNVSSCNQLTCCSKPSTCSGRQSYSFCLTTAKGSCSRQRHGVHFINTD